MRLCGQYYWLDVTHKIAGQPYSPYEIAYHNGHLPLWISTIPRTRGGMGEEAEYYNGMRGGGILQWDARRRNITMVAWARRRNITKNIKRKAVHLLQSINKSLCDYFCCIIA